MLKQTVFLILLLTVYVHSYNFLVFCPLFGHSHTTFFAQIADTLTDAGHNVTFFTPTLLRIYENVTYVKSTKHVVKLPASRELNILSDKFGTSDMTKFWTKDSSLLEFVPTMKFGYKLLQLSSEWIYENIEVLDGLKGSYKYDAMIYEPFVYLAYPIMDYLEIKTQIPAASVIQDRKTAKLIGEMFMPSATSDVNYPFDENMTLQQRVLNALVPTMVDYYLGIPEFLSYTTPRKPIDILSRIPKSPFLFINSNPYLDFPRPTITKTVQIGGISVNMEKMKKEKIDKEVDNILNLGSKSILISFGSVQESQFMPDSYKSTIVEVISKFPEVTFIWKYESDNHFKFSQNLSNVHFLKWVPQRAMLLDPRLTAFFTHGGPGSVNEISYTGKRAILCPIFGDQAKTAKMLVRHGGAIEYSKHDLDNPQKLEEVIRSILYDPKYGENARNLARRLEKQPIKPADLLVKHCEFAAEFGELPSLDPYSRQMSFISYFMIDIALIFLSVIIGLVGLIYIILRNIFRRIRGRKSLKIE